LVDWWGGGSGADVVVQESGIENIDRRSGLGMNGRLDRI